MKNIKMIGKIHDDFVKVFSYARDCKKMGTSNIDLPSVPDIQMTAGFIEKFFKESYGDELSETEAE